MNLEETKKYLERRLGDLGWSVRIDKTGFQTIQKYSGGDKERLNHLYYKLVSVGSRQERREINGDTIHVAIDDLERMAQIVETAPLNLGQNNRHDFDRLTIEQLASSLEQKVAEEIETAVSKTRSAKAPASAAGGNGKDHSARAAMSAAMTAAAAGGATRKPRILVVDDSPTIRAAVTKALENDFEFVQASDGEKGWKLLRANTDIKLVVTDLMMPKLDGYDLIKRIRSAKADPWILKLPVIVVTALEDTQAKLRALMVGANDFITKNTDTLELQARVIARYQLAESMEKAVDGVASVAASVPVATEIGPPSRQMSAAFLGDRAPTITKQAMKIEGQTKAQGVAPQPAVRTAASVTQIQAPPLPGVVKNTKPVEETALSGSVHRVLEFFRGVYRRLERLDPTTGITLLATFLVIVTIAGVIFVNRSQPKPNPGDVGATMSPTADADESVANTSTKTIETDAHAGSVATDATAEPMKTAPEEAAPPSAARPPVAEQAKRPPDIVAAKSQSTPEPRRETANVAAQSRSTSRPVSPEPKVASAPVVESSAATPAVDSSAVVEAAAASTPEDPASLAGSPTTPPDSPITVAQTARPELTSFAGNRITQDDLSALMKKFVFVYQAGDIDQFLSLFDDEVRTNERTNKAGLREDYESLFKTTTMRQINLGNVAWEILDRTAQGWSNFEVRVRNEGEDDIKVFRGSLTFHVEKSGGRARITKMYHGQWRATNTK